MYDRESAALERRHDRSQDRQLVEQIADELADLVKPSELIADLGCGPGIHTTALAQRGYDVVGLDGSPRMIEVAQARAKRNNVNASFKVCDVSATLPFEDSSIGGILAILIVQHLPDPGSFIAEIRRSLQRGGHLLIVAPVRTNKSPMSRNLYWRLRSTFYRHAPGVVRFYDTDSLTRLVKDHGLTVIECTGEPNRVTVLARRETPQSSVG